MAASSSSTDDTPTSRLRNLLGVGKEVRGVRFGRLPLVLGLINDKLKTERLNNRPTIYEEQKRVVTQRN